jgi:chromosome transmission fidelity protein 1
LTWLRDHKGKAFEEDLGWGQNGMPDQTMRHLSTNSVVDSNEPEWIIEQARARKRREMLRQREDMEARLAKIRAKEKAQREKYLKGDQSFKRRKAEAEKKGENDEEEFVLEDYDSDREQKTLKKGVAAIGFSAATLELMDKLGMGTAVANEEEDEVEDEIKVSNHVSLT